MAEKDWIEQSEFDRRRALFEGKGKPKAASPSIATGGYEPDAVEQGKPPAVPIRVTICSIGGDTVLGPEEFTSDTCLEDIIYRLRSHTEGNFARSRLLNGTQAIASSATVADLCQTNCDSLNLTVVQNKPLPENARIVGDLAVWPRKSTSEESNEHSDEVKPCLMKSRRQGVEENMKGICCSTGDIFSYSSREGRCTTISLRLGKAGLYYNSSSHGTATLVYQKFATADGSTGTSDGSSSEDEDCTTQHAIIPGTHHPGPKDPSAVEGAMAFIRRLMAVSGHQSSHSGPASQQVDSWLECCHDIGIRGMHFATLFMPWIRELGGMNEFELFQWSQSGYPQTIAEIEDDRARSCLEVGITPEGAY